MSTILVAGGAGLLGSAIARRLIPTDALVLVADVFDESGDGRAAKEERAAAFHGHPRAGILRVDLTDTREVARVFAEERPATVVNALRFAGSGSGVAPLATAAREAGIGLFVHLSDGALYGPAPEPDRHAREDEPLDPGEDPYLKRKAAEEALLLEAGLPLTVLRVFTPIGPLFPVSRFPAKAFEAVLSGEVAFLPDDEPRDFVHVDDIARAVELALARRPIGAIFNVGTGVATRPSDLLQKLAWRVGKPLRLSVAQSTPIPPRSPRAADLEAAWGLLGFSPLKGIEDAVDEIVQARLTPEAFQAAISSRATIGTARRPRPADPAREVSRRELFDLFRRPFGRGGRG